MELAGRLVTVDTGWLIAAERSPAAARKHIAALVRRTQILAVSPGVVVEGLQRARDPRTIQVVLAKLWKEPSTYEDAVRAAALLRATGRASGEPHWTVHEIGVVDGLVAAMAERLSGIVYTGDPRHMNMLRDAGAAITVAPVPF